MSFQLVTVHEAETEEKEGKDTACMFSSFRELQDLRLHRGHELTWTCINDFSATVVVHQGFNTFTYNISTYKDDMNEVWADSTEKYLAL